LGVRLFQSLENLASHKDPAVFSTGQLFEDSGIDHGHIANA